MNINSIVTNEPMAELAYNYSSILSSKSSLSNAVAANQLLIPIYALISENQVHKQMHLIGFSANMLSIPQQINAF